MAYQATILEQRVYYKATSLEVMNSVYQGG